MIGTRLILVDGMTGAGKSTTAQRLALHIEALGHPARWFHEHDTTHPIWRPGEQERMAEAGRLDPGLLEAVLPARWAALAAECARLGGVTILDGTLLQGTAGFLLAMREEEPAIAAHLLDAAEAIAGLEPVLIHLRQPDPARALAAVFADREADGYAANLVTLIAGTPYGRAHGVRDAAGLLRFYAAWCGLADRLFGRLPMARLAVDAAAGDWPARELQITEFLGLPPIREAALPVDRPARYLGRYRDARSGDELVVAGGEAGLHLADARGTRLIARRDGGFEVAALGIEARFGEERDGCFRRLELRGSLPGLSPLWIRVEAGA